MSTATPVPSLTSRLKAVSPAGARRVGRDALRSWGRLTAGWRPDPEFLVIGTKRGGTTTLFRALQDHPQVLRMFPAGQDLKSPHYFDLHHDRGRAWYRSHFPSALARRPTPAGNRITGEASPYYLFHPLAPARVAAELPSVRLVVALRNPVDRAFSHHWDRVKAGIETLPFDEAIEAEEGRLAGEEDRLLADPLLVSEPHEHFSYLARGRYAEQLRSWFEALPRDRFLVLRSEDLYAEPQATYERVLQFLGLPPHARRGEFGRHHGHADRPTMDPGIRRELQAHFTPYNTDLAELLGEPEWW